jgi:uncharacterized protein
MISINFSFAEKVSDLKIEKYVNDYANIIDDNQESILEKDLYDFFASTTHQIVVVTVNNMDSDYIENYSIKLAEKIKAGGEKNDNGVILLVSKDDRKIRIEVGYGLEEVMTDGKSSYIVDKVMTPNFKNGDYTKGISEGVDEIKKFTSLKNYDPEINWYEKDIFYGLTFLGSIAILISGSGGIFLISTFILACKKGFPRYLFGGIFPPFISLFFTTYTNYFLYIFFLSFVFGLFLAFILRNKEQLKDSGSGGGNNHNTWTSGGGGSGGGYSSSGGGFSGGGGGFGGGGASGSW